MELKTGDKIKYFFPNPSDKENTFVTGMVESIGDYHISLLTEDQVKLKISFKNFHFIKPDNSRDFDTIKKPS